MQIDKISLSNIASERKRKKNVYKSIVYFNLIRLKVN